MLLDLKRKSLGHHPCVAAAVVGGSLVGGYMSSQAASSAASDQENASNNATQAQENMYNQTVANEQPYMTAGSSAMSSLTGQLPSLTTPINNSNWEQYMDPSYSFQLQQGQQALQNSQAAGDGAMSGAAMKGLIGYNQNMAQTGYQNAFQDYQTQNQNIYNRLAGVAQLGQNAASNTGMTGAGMAGGIANTITGTGNAEAAGAIGSANAYTGAANNLSSMYMMNNMTGGNLFGNGSAAGYDNSGTDSIYNANPSAYASSNAAIGYNPTPSF